MHDFHYVSKKEAAPVKADLLELIKEVQNLVRDEFTFQYKFVGSSSRNMITCDTKSNIGYDFDVNFEVNDDEENYTPKQIRKIIKIAIDKVVLNHGYDYSEDSTRVLTIKKKDYDKARILHSCDFAIVRYYEDGQKYIRFNKETNKYTWEFTGKAFESLSEKIDWLKENDLWNNLKDYYIEKKNKNNNPDKHSRSIFAESVNEMCQKYGYFD